MIKIVVISHAYVEPFTRVGLVSNELYPEFEQTVIIPEYLAKKYSLGYKKLVDEGYRVITVKTSLNIHNSVRFYSFTLLKYLKESNPDIIFINNEPWSTTAFQTIFFCKLLRLKTKAVIYTSENLIRKYPIPFRWFEKYALNNTNLVLTVTKNEGREILLRYKKYKGKVEYLPLSVNTDVFRKIDVSDLKKSLLNNFDATFTIGYVGRIVKEKGIDTLIEAISSLEIKDKLIIIGDGPYKESLLKLIKKFNLSEKVIFIDRIFYSELPRYINCMDLLILPSITTSNWREQFGRVLIEAMACEVPVIGSSSGEIPEVVNGVGLIFQEKNVQELKEKILQLYSNPELRKKLGMLGRKYVKSLYDTKVIMQKTVDVYKNL